jgi:uncharacterized cupredoxin-like copper-binding protein
VTFVQPSFLIGALAGVLLLGCSGAGSVPAASMTPVAPTNGQIALRAFDMGFDPPAITLHTGEQMEIVLNNDGSTLHDLKVAGLDADLIQKDSSGPLSGDKGELFVSASPGRQATLTFIPREAGTFTFYCTISGHRRLGMEGAITVE